MYLYNKIEAIEGAVGQYNIQIFKVLNCNRDGSEFDIH